MRENLGDEAKNKHKDKNEPYKTKKRADLPLSVVFSRGSFVLWSTGGGPQHEEPWAGYNDEPPEGLGGLSDA